MILRNPNLRYCLSGALLIIFIFIFGFQLRYSWPQTERSALVSPGKPVPVPEPRKPRYKPAKPALSYPIVDNFPRALAARSAADLPPLPAWNKPPSTHVHEKTPLFIGFTRNWRLLQQVVVSYITAGWPPSDIYVVENTGVMHSNKKGQLSLQNPFFLNHTRLDLLGVNVLITPTLFTFAQLQNYYMWTALEKKWDQYFWSHMDVVALSFEDRWINDHPGELSPTSNAFPSIYDYCVDALRKATRPDIDGNFQKWGTKFFSYDRLTLVNTEAYNKVGGWDTMIPFYKTDCDMHERLAMENYTMNDMPAGAIWDIASSLDDLEVLYRKKEGPKPSFIDPNAIEVELSLKAEALEEQKQARDLSVETIGNLLSGKKKIKWTDDEVGQEGWKKLLEVLDHMGNSKSANGRGRNTWQSRQVGGQDDPYYRDSEGFQQAIQMTIDHGMAVFAEKWGHRDCDLIGSGLGPKDAWRVERDWEPVPNSLG